MSSTFKVLFYLRKNYLNKEGKAPIMVRITIDVDMVQFSSKLDLDPTLWDSKNSKAKGRSRVAEECNNALEQIKSSIINHYRRLCDTSSVVNAQKLRNAYMGVETRSESLIALFTKFIDDTERSFETLDSQSTKRNATISPATLQKYKVTRRRLTEFLKKRYKLTDIPLKDIDHQFVTDFNTYLRVDGECAVNTTAKFMRLFKRFIILAKHNGWIVRDPFANFKIKLENVDRGYLTQDEMERILSKKFTVKRLELVRDIFLFSCFTGYSYIDVRNLTKDNIRESFDGRLWIMSKRQKTNVKSNVLLLDVPMKIIAKYESHNNGENLLPILCNQKLTRQGRLGSIAVSCWLCD